MQSILFMNKKVKQKKEKNKHKIVSAEAKVHVWVLQKKRIIFTELK